MTAALLLLAAAAPGEACDPLTAPRPAAVRAALYADHIGELGADDYHTRVRAEDRLVRAGADAADRVAAAARDADLERRTRAVEVLARALRSAAAEGREGDAGDLLAALRTVADDPAVPGDAAAAAVATLDRFPTTATRAAIAALRADGAAVMEHTIEGITGSLHYSVTLDDRWTGGSAGLARLRDVTPLGRVHVTDGALPDDARQALDAGAFGNFAVERRGKAFLGIQFNATVGNGCVIEQVTAGGPADRAGLKGGDEILSFGGRDVAGPGALLDAIREIGTLGEPTPVTVRRAAERFDGPQKVETVRVTLARWPDGVQKQARAPRLPPNFRAVPLQIRPPRMVPRPATPEPPGVDPADGGDTPD